MRSIQSPFGSNPYSISGADADIVVVIRTPERMHPVGPQRHTVGGIRRRASERGFKRDHAAGDLRVVAHLDIPAWHAGVAAHGAAVFLGGLVVFQHGLEDERR